MHHPTAPIRLVGRLYYDEQSTNKLLKQLELSLRDVEAIIQKSKQSIGINGRSVSPDKSGGTSTLKFNLSGQLGTCSKDELVYSVSPSANSGIRGSETARMTSHNTTGSILRKLKFEDGDQIVDVQDREGISAVRDSPPYFRSRDRTVKQEDCRLVESKIEQDSLDHLQQSKVLPVVQEQKCEFNIVITPTKSMTESAGSMEELQTKVKNSYFKYQLNYCNKQQKVEIPSEQAQHDRTFQQNTCSRNQLENILSLKNHSSKKVREMQKNGNYISNNCNNYKNQIKFTYEEYRKQKKAIICTSPLNNCKNIAKTPPKTQKDAGLSPNTNLSKGRARTPQKSNSKSPSKLTTKSPQRQPSSITTSPSSSKPYNIQKYANSLSEWKSKPQQPSATQPRRPQQANSSPLKYSHPRKSPQNKKSAKAEMQQLQQTAKQMWDKSKFMQKMGQQCYVRRFLTSPELSRIYDEFLHRAVPQFQWQQRVIEKIFRKIHQVDDLI